VIAFIFARVGVIYLPFAAFLVSLRHGHYWPVFAARLFAKICHGDKAN
jgi:hypothetical protein